MSVVLTKAAAQHVQQLLQQRGHGVGLRLATRHAGCSGVTYVVDYVDKKSAGDSVFESYGINVYVNKDDLANLDGTEIDYVKTGAINMGFEFNNPQAKDLCGCGESFSI